MAAENENMLHEEMEAHDSTASEQNAFAIHRFCLSSSFTHWQEGAQQLKQAFGRTGQE